MPTLHWIGKDKVINHHQDVPFRLLDHQYGALPDGTQTAEPTGSGNQIIHGDNLEALKALLPQYEGRVKCIYIDPPYNTGNEGWVYNDNVNDPKIKKWLSQVVGKEGEDLSRHDKWLCMMYPRLKLLHKLLAEDGFIFVSIDYNEEANLRLLMNEIFGIGNFRNCIAVRRGIKNVQAQFEDINALSVGHEYILLYSKKTAARLPKLSKNLALEKAGKWDTFWRGTDRPTMRYELLGQHPERGQWRWEEGRALRASENYKRYQERHADSMTLDEYYFDHYTATNEKFDLLRRNDEGVVQYYVAPQATKLLSDNWMDITLSGSYTSFDTEKTTEIIERIIEWVCPAGSTILDSFAGSGTTAHAILNLNKRDKGERKFILVEMEDYAEHITAERVKRVMQGYAGQPGTGGSFDYLTLGEPVFTESGELNERAGRPGLRQYLYYAETKQPLPPETADDNAAFLGQHDGAAYYFHYEPDEVTTLNHEFLSTIRTKSGQYIIYADNCLLTPEFMTQHGLIFKKIPRDISRF